MSMTILSEIDDVIDDIKLGKPIIVVDDEGRENEGDLIVAADKITPETINFMAKYGRGLICLPLEKAIYQHLGLERMGRGDNALHRTAFTASIEAKTGVTTGISAADRARTIQVAVDPSSSAQDIATPGHVFPLMARDGGVLERDGHTEAAVDLAKLAGLRGAGVICEIMNDDGTMARMDDLVIFAREHGLKIISIADLIAYRYRHELFFQAKSLSSSGPAQANCAYYALSSKYASSAANGAQIYQVMIYGDVDATLKSQAEADVPVYLHQINLRNDLCGDNGGRAAYQCIQDAKHDMDDSGGGVFIFVNDPGFRGQDELGAAQSAQIYYDIGQILKYFKIANIRLTSAYFTGDGLIDILNQMGINIVAHQSVAKRA